MSQDSVNAPESLSNFIHPVNLKFACKQPTGLLLLQWCFAVYPLDSYFESGGAILSIYLPRVDESVSDAICSATSRAPCYCEVSSPGEHPHPPGQRACWKCAATGILQERLKGLCRFYPFPSYTCEETGLAQRDSSKWTRIIWNVEKLVLLSYRHPAFCAAIVHFHGQWASLLSSWLEAFSLLWACFPPEIKVLIKPECMELHCSVYYSFISTHLSPAKEYRARSSLSYVHFSLL